MNKVFEKIIEKLEEREVQAYAKTDTDAAYTAYRNAIEIVEQSSIEYNNGWIPCSERLPEDDSICIVTVEYPNNETVVDYGWFDRIGVCWYVGIQEFRTSNIIAWQPLPLPYKERD